MATKLKQTYNVCKSIVAKLRGKREFNGRNKLKGNDRRRVIDAQKLFVLTISSFRAMYGYKPRVDAVSNLVDLLNHTDVKVFLTMLGELDSGLLNNQNVFALENSISQASETKAIADVLELLLRPFIQGWFRNNDEISFQVLHQVYAMLSRLSLSVDELRQTAYDTWAKTEFRVTPLPQGTREQNIISGWFPSERSEEFFSNFIPAHGTGQVNPKVSYYLQKFHYLALSPAARLFLCQIGLSETNLYRLLSGRAIHSQEWTCLLAFVNKSWKTYRTISMEPVTTMWLQQGVGHCLDIWLKDHKSAFSRYYSITSEWKNRHLALIGSLHGCYDTIDLSAASDSVSWELVKHWFAKSLLRYAITCTRTKYVEVPRCFSGSVYEQSKFAPMGSRMCFPVETIVFGAIAKYSTECAGLSDDTEEFPNFVVYGDDIVIRHEATPYLLQRLSECGFVVNESKSFTEYDNKFCFRESCGAEFLNGISVKPIRLSRNGFHGFPKDLENPDESLPQIAGLISLANACESKIPFVRWFIIDYLSDMQLPVCWSEDGSRGLKTLNPSYRFDTKYEHRWNSDYQQYEVRVLQLTPKPKSIPKVLDFQYYPRQSEYDSYEEYAAACAQYQDVYYKNIERDGLQEYLLYDSLATLEKRKPKRRPIDDAGEIRPLFGLEDLTLTLSWIPDPKPVRMIGMQVTRPI